MTDAKGKSPAPGNAPEEPMFTKQQLVNAKTLGLPRDAVAALLDGGTLYTKTQAKQLVSDFLHRKV